MSRISFHSSIYNSATRRFGRAGSNTEIGFWLMVIKANGASLESSLLGPTPRFETKYIDRCRPTTHRPWICSSKPSWLMCPSHHTSLIFVQLCPALGGQKLDIYIMARGAGGAPLEYVYFLCLSLAFPLSFASAFALRRY